MERNLFERSFIEKLNRNFQNQAKYFEFEFYVFSELRSSIFEINQCLILEFYRASITLTNNLLERLLKLSLIYDEAGIGSKPTENWSSIFEGPNKKYSSNFLLSNSIEKCKKLDLINESEKVFLFHTIRELFRNGFSHADSSKILSGIPDETLMFHASLSNPTEIKPITLNPKVVPFIQAVHIENFAKQNASAYFDFVFELAKKIDSRLLDKHK